MADVNFGDGIVCAYTDLDEIVTEIAQKIRSEGWWILVPHPSLLTKAIHLLSGIPECVYYGDNGTPRGVAITGERAAEFMYLPAVTLAGQGIVTFVITIPKSVTAATLSALFVGDTKFNDGQDIVMLSNGHEIGWPAILLDALEAVSPGSTAPIREAAD